MSIPKQLIDLINNPINTALLRRMLAEGEASGITDYSYDRFIAELDETSSSDKASST